MWIDPSTNSYVVPADKFCTSKSREECYGLTFQDRDHRGCGHWCGCSGCQRSRIQRNHGGRWVRRMIAPNHRVLTGIDVLEQEKFATLKGKRVGLITNQSGFDLSGRRTIDAMRAGGVQLTALFSPEHGIAGKEDRLDVADAKDPGTGLPVWSLHYNGSLSNDARDAT